MESRRNVALPVAVLFLAFACQDPMSAPGPTGGTGAASGGTPGAGGTTPDSGPAAGSDGGPAGAGGAAPDGSTSGCLGASRETCEGLWRCHAIFGRPATDPFILSYAGCRTAFDEKGGSLLYTGSVMCGRVGAAAVCYFLASGAHPDVWEQLVCTALPAECGVSGKHPAFQPLGPVGECEGLTKNACEATTVCAPVDYASGPEQGGYAGCRSVYDLAGGVIPTGAAPYCGRPLFGPRCWELSSRPPDGWILEPCTAACK